LAVLPLAKHCVDPDTAFVAAHGLLDRAMLPTIVKAGLIFLVGHIAFIAVAAILFSSG
jgi:hypothetical protein